MTAVRLPPDDDLRITTERLRLTPLLAADADDLFPVLNHPRLHDFIGGTPATLEELRQRFARWQARRSPDGGQLWLNWVVRLAPDDRPVGYVQATVEDERAAIAYVIGSAWAGQGIATEAVVGMCDALWRLGIRDVEAHIHPAHLASAAVARHAGLVPTGEHDHDGEQRWTSSAAAVGSPSRRRAQPGTD